MDAGPYVLNAVDAPTYEQLAGLEGITVYHQEPWHRVLQRAFGWRVKALVDYDADGRLALFLPFVEKRRLGRRVRVSLPLSHRIGPAVRSGYCFSFPAWLAPFEAHAEVPGLEPYSAHVVTELDLTHFADANELLARFHPGQIQRRIRKATGFQLRSGSDAELFHAFNKLQATTRRRQGAPTYPRSFFPVMAEELGRNARCHLAIRHGRATAGVIFMHYGHTATYGFGASSDDIAARNRGANQLVMWSAIREAFECGCSAVDFGSSPARQEPLWRYKERWGGVTRPLVHSSVGMKPVSQDGALTRLGGALLKRLPLPFFAAVSPALLRSVL